MIAWLSWWTQIYHTTLIFEDAEICKDNVVLVSVLDTTAGSASIYNTFSVEDSVQLD